MDNITVGKIIGAVTTHASSMTSGIDASTEVAARCLGGRSLGQLFVFHSTFDANSRYQGMKKAFGDDTEIFRVVGSNPPKELDASDYDKMVSTALAAAKAIKETLTTSNTSTSTSDRSTSTSSSTQATSRAPSAAAATSASPDQHIAEELNPYLCVHANFPIIKWGQGIHPWPVTAVYTMIGLGAMLGVMFLKWYWGAGAPGIAELLYGVVFIMISGFTFILLDVKRQVCYVTITENDVSEGACSTWRELKDCAKEGFPAAERGHEGRAIEEALKDLKLGRVRIDATGLHVPVMAVRNVVEDDLASWLTLLNDLPGPLMSAGLFCLPDDHINWGVAYGVAAYMQSRLQHAVAERYIQDAKTRGVFWFKRVDGHLYAVHGNKYHLDTDIFKRLRDTPWKVHKNKKGIPW